MAMHLPAVRRGLIPQTVTYDPYMGGMEQYGRLALRTHHRNYGGVWAYKKKKRTQCKGYDDAVKRYEDAKSDHKKKGCTTISLFGARRDKCKKTAGRMRAAEAEGKAAWKECEAYTKGVEKGHVQIDTTGEGFTSVDTVVPPVMGIGGDPSLMGPGMGMGVSGGSTEEEPSNTGLYLAVGALLLATGGIVIYKRSKKKKSGR